MKNTSTATTNSRVSSPICACRSAFVASRPAVFRSGLREHLVQGPPRLTLLGVYLHEQKRLASRFEGLQKTNYATSRTLAKLKSTNAGLMQDPLTSNRRVTALLEQRDRVTT